MTLALVIFEVKSWEAYAILNLQQRRAHKESGTPLNAETSESFSVTETYLISHPTDVHASTSFAASLVMKRWMTENVGCETERSINIRRVGYISDLDVSSVRKDL